MDDALHLMIKEDGRAKRLGARKSSFSFSFQHIIFGMNIHNALNSKVMLKAKEDFRSTKRFAWPDFSLINRFVLNTFSIFLLFNLCLILLPSLASAAEVTLQPLVIQASANQPIIIELEITHTKDQTIDPKSFSKGNTPLNAELYKETPQSDGSILSQYRIQLPQQAQGIYILSPISIKIGGKVYETSSLIYNVSSAASQPPPTLQVPQASPTTPQPTPAPTTTPQTPPTVTPAATPANPPSETITSPTPTPPSTTAPSTPPPILLLKALVDGPKVIYPGQKFRLIYQIWYHTNVNLSVEQLPLLSATGFMKLGSEEITNSIENDSNVQTIVLNVRAIEPGSFHFPGSKLAGMAYTQDASGNIVYLTKEPYKSETPPITIEVAPFPTANKPASFNGALGNYEMSVKMLTRPTVSVGDEIKLGFEITGTGELSTVSLPDLHCQPGFSGFFNIKLPPFVTDIPNGKHFELTLIPINDAAREIPSIEFSFFDPTATAYHRLQTPALPITIKKLAIPSPVENPEPVVKNVPEPDWKSLWSHPPHPEIQENVYLTESDVHPPFWKTAYTLWIIPVGLLLVLAQFFWRWYSEFQRSRIPPSYALFHEAVSEPNIPLLEKAFLMRLFEKGWIPSPADSPDDLADAGLVGETRRFLSEVQTLHYSGASFSPDPLIKRAKQLFNQISHGTPKTL